MQSPFFVIARHAPLFSSLRGALAVARRSQSKLEHEIPRFTRNKLRNLMGIAICSARNDRAGTVLFQPSAGLDYLMV